MKRKLTQQEIDEKIAETGFIRHVPYDKTIPFERQIRRFGTVINERIITLPAIGVNQDNYQHTWYDIDTGSNQIIYVGYIDGVEEIASFSKEPNEYTVSKAAAIISGDDEVDE